MTKTVCNMCGREFDIWDEQEHFHFYADRIGYGSKYDDHKLRLDLCCDCMDRIIDVCKIHPTVDLG